MHTNKENSSDTVPLWQVR